MHFDTALYTVERIHSIVVGTSVANVHFYVCCFISDGFSIFGSQEDSKRGFFFRWNLLEKEFCFCLNSI